MPYSPTLEGFRAILRRPSLGLAEIAWRWSFGAAGAWLIGFTFIEYMDTLPVTRGDLLLLRTRQPALVAQAFQHIFKGSAPRLVEAGIVLALGSALAWIVVAALARAATVRALVSHFRSREDWIQSALWDEKRWSLRSLLGLNSLRVAVTFAGMVGLLGALLAGHLVSPATDPSPGSASLVSLCVAMLVWLAWSGLNWFLSLASVLAVADGRDALDAMGVAVELCRTRTGSIFAAGAWFGAAHLAAFVFATTAVAFPLSLSAALPPGVTLGGVLLVTLLYFAVADFLHVGRLAAYVALLKLPDVPQASVMLPEAPDSSLDGRVDPHELILGDLPLLGET